MLVLWLRLLWLLGPLRLLRLMKLLGCQGCCCTPGLLGDAVAAVVGLVWLLPKELWQLRLQRGGFSFPPTAERNLNPQYSHAIPAAA